MMNSKTMAAGGAAKKGTHKMPDGTTMKNSDMKSMKTGGMAMTMKDGKKVPAFAADGKGKMAAGGMAKKGYAAGGAVGGAAMGKALGALGAAAAGKAAGKAAAADSAKNKLRIAVKNTRTAKKM